MATPLVRPALTKADYAYSEVRERIMSGALPHGAVVSQEALAAELSVSTTPLREAMRRLSAEGLVVLDAHRDARVAPLSAAEARSLFEIRQQLDPLAVRLPPSGATTRTASGSGTPPPTWSRWTPAAVSLRSTRTAPSTSRSTGPPTTTC